MTLCLSASPCLAANLLPKIQLMNKNWPIIRKTKNHGKAAFLVDSRIQGKGERRFFDTKAEAEGFAALCRIRRKNEGTGASVDSRLAAHGWTVHQAIEFALQHLDRKSKSSKVSDAIAALIEEKENDSGIGKIRASDVKNRLEKFRDFKVDENTIGDFTIEALTPNQDPGSKCNEEPIKKFLSTIPNPVTRNDYRKEIFMLWRFAFNKGWTSKPLTKENIPKASEPDKARIILTVEEAKQLMEASTDKEVMALNALVLFGGCRREEVEKMDWKNINFKSGHIEISAEISKVNAERFAPILPNLRAWLKPIAKKSGPIVSRVLMHVLRKTWKQAGLYPWPQDAHRHSFISYRRRIIGDSQTALDAGTSESIIKKHYKRPTTKTEAKKFFSIMPE